MSIEIKKYNSTYLKDVLFIWEKASKVAHHFLNESFMENERRNISENYLPQTETWVALCAEKVVGFISLIGDEVGALFVDPEFHHKGIGKILMDKAISLKGSVEVLVFEENAIGRSFYSKYGFRQIGQKTHPDTGHVLLRLMYNPIF